jgi:nucleoside-diphosphate-sugar epimerase
MTKVLIIGSQGQIGTELTKALCDKFGIDNVVASDIRKNSEPKCEFVELNALDKAGIIEVIKKHGITDVYLLAAMLSATAEKNPELAWDLNMNSLFHVLNLAKDGIIKKVYWPSSIAVFGPSTPRIDTPQFTVCEPNTIYGISKYTGERWCEYYHQKYGVDVRSLRYPGLISYTSPPGGGTTDYAVDIFHEAIKSGNYSCFLSSETLLPMMYMSDAIKATLQIMEAPAEQIKIRSSYNLAAFSFTPAELASSIEKHIPGFKVSYNPDFRQKIADSWPGSIDDSRARMDWNWKNEFNFEQMVADMIKNLKIQYQSEKV